MANLNTAISPAPAITCYTKGGAVATGYSGNVTVSLGTNPTGATLGGTLTVAASSGVATFSDLTLNRSGKNFKLSGSATGLRSATSAAFSIPTELVFTTQPASTSIGATMANVVVTVRDSAGNTDTTYTGNITVAIYSSTAAGVLSGTKTVAAVAGVATFSTLSINLEGTYTLVASASTIATCYPPASVVSDSFAIGQYILTAGYHDGLPTLEIYGYDPANGIGSITPTTFNGSTIRFLSASNLISFALQETTIAINGIADQSFFTSITLNGNTYLSSAASYTQGALFASWTWSGLAVDQVGAYPLTIT